MDCGKELNKWLVKDHSSEETSMVENIFEFLGLSTDYKDWLMVEESDDCQAVTGNTEIMGQGRSQVCPESDDMIGQNPNIISNPPSCAVLAVEEITNRDLKYWLCEPEIYGKFKAALDLKNAGKKRKLDEEYDDVIESQKSMKV